MSHAQARARLRVSVLGVGAMGRLHARIFAQGVEELVLAGVYDVDASRAHEVGRLWSVPAYADEAKAIAAADLVVIASPIEAHGEAALHALARGRHVFIEKPVCATAEEAFALTRAAQRGQRIFVGHSERFNPVVRALHAAVRGDDIRTIRLRRTSVAVRAGAEHAALVSLGVHDLDLVAYLTGSPVTVREVAYLDADRAELVLVGASGVVAWLHVDRRADARERTIEVVTNDSIYTGDLFAKSLSVRPSSGGTVVDYRLIDEEPLVAQAMAIARALRGAEGSAAGGVEGARALALAEDAFIRQQRDGRLASGAS
jgi:predicted dehydrogenase